MRSGGRADFSRDLAALGLGGVGMMLWAAWAVPAALLGLTACLGACLLLLAWFDATMLRLPDILTLTLAALGLAASGTVAAAPLDHLLGAALAFGICWVVAAWHQWSRGGDGLGMGDAKLCAAGGAWLGIDAVPSLLLLSCLGAGLWLLALSGLRGRSALAEPLPFGIPLAAAIWLLWLYGAP